MEIPSRDGKGCDEAIQCSPKPDMPELIHSKKAARFWALLFNLDAVITTPSTVAVDAARAGRPVAVIGNDLLLPMYEPLPILREVDDWAYFLENLGDLQSISLNNDVFLRRHRLSSGGHFRAASKIWKVVKDEERPVGDLFGCCLADELL